MSVLVCDALKQSTQQLITFDIIEIYFIQNGPNIIVVGDDK